MNIEDQDECTKVYSVIVLYSISGACNQEYNIIITRAHTPRAS